MKKTFTLIIATMLTISMYAFPNQSNLFVSASGNSNFYITVDGNRYRAFNNVVEVNNLTSGLHQVQVFQLKVGVRNYGYNSFKMLFSNTIYVKPGFDIDITINRFGKVFLDEQCDDNTNNSQWNNNPGSNNAGNNNQWNNNQNNNNWNNNPMNNIMSAASFEQLKRTLENAAFDNTKMTLAKQVIAANLFSTAQIKELMVEFSSENSKLELAKYAYQYTVDKGNYFTLVNEFSFANNKESLMRYIQSAG